MRNDTRSRLCEKYFALFLNFLSKMFVNSKTCLTFALAFGKQRGNAASAKRDRSLTTFHYRQAVQPCFIFFLKQEA